jgi:hypothetical protein
MVLKHDDDAPTALAEFLPLSSLRVQHLSLHCSSLASLYSCGSDSLTDSDKCMSWYAIETCVYVLIEQQ